MGLIIVGVKTEFPPQPPGETRRLAAIMFTDIVGFSRQMGADEARTLRLLAVHNQVIEQAVAAHQGHTIKTTGDGFLIEFSSVVHAVQCAQSIQAQFQAHNAEKTRAEQIHVRVGLHEGDILMQPNGDVLGDGVNIASRLQTFAEPDTICISQKVYDEVEKKIPLGTVVLLGRPKLKNITPRFQVYALLSKSPKGLRQTLQVQRLKLSRRVRPAYRVVMAGLLLIAVTIIAARSLPFLFPNTQHLTSSTPEALPLPDKPSLVVLPFVNLSEDSGQEYFSDGLTEDLTSALSRLSSLFVISRNTAFFYKGKAVKMPELSKELGVQYVLEGSVRKAGGQVRVTAQLLDAIQDHHLWSERYDRPLKDIFALQDEIVQKMVTTLQLQLSLQEQGILVKKTTDNLEAYDTFLRGQESWLHAYYERNKDAHTQARQLFERAVALDPHYAQAYSQLGLTYFLDWFYGWDQTPQTLERAGELARQAITLDGSLSVPHVGLSYVYLWQKQHDLAIKEAERAIALDPNGAEGYVNLGGVLAWAGRPEEGIQMVERGIRLNPRYPLNYIMALGFTYRIAGRYEEAIATAKKILVRQPNFAPAYFLLAYSCAQLDRLDEARAAGAEFQRLVPHASLEQWKQMAAFKDPALLERDLAALRKAGWKEK
ncbi:MAG: tetratricopeptide repeat protein [Deltaproteobacteria bacterium]|nr:tetratricopeptide repeat protein [Deltaproteobacteria bacterium]